MWPINMEILRMSQKKKPKIIINSCEWGWGPGTSQNCPMEHFKQLVGMGFNARVLNSKHMLKHFNT